MLTPLPCPPDARRSRFGPWLVAILGAAVLVRIAVLVYAEHRPALFDFPDSHRYVRVARNIAAGLGPIDSADVRAGTDPLYPAILAVGVQLGFDTSDDPNRDREGAEDQSCDREGADAGGYPVGLMRWGRIVNAFCGVISVALLAAFARRLLGNDRAALVAAGILALDPILLFFNALVLTEAPYIAIVLAAFYCLTRVGERHGWIWCAASGALLGLATLTRGSSLFLPLILAPLVWYFARRLVSDTSRARKEAAGGMAAAFRAGPSRPGSVGGHAVAGCSRPLLATACFLLAAAVTLLPTVVRNYGLFGRLVPVRTGSGASLMEALGPWADGGPGMDRIVSPPFPAQADECARDQTCRRAAIDWAQDHPAETVHLAWAKLRRTWSVTINAPGYSSAPYAVVAWLTVAPEFICAALGTWRLRRRPAVLLLLLAVALYFTAVHVVFVGSVRYRIPAMPFLFVLAGVGVAGLRSCGTGVSPVSPCGTGVSPVSSATEDS